MYPPWILLFGPNANAVNFLLRAMAPRSQIGVTFVECNDAKCYAPNEYAKSKVLLVVCAEL